LAHELVASDECVKRMTDLERVPLLSIDDLGMRKLPPTAAEDLLGISMRRYERASTIVTSTRPGRGSNGRFCGDHQWLLLK